MEYIVGAGTDIGTKGTNQDSYAIKVASSGDKRVVMALVCDGMGGLQEGEVASAYVTTEMSKWFEEELPNIINDEDLFDKLREQWEAKLHLLNEKLVDYGRRNGYNIGSTIAALFMCDGQYFMVNVGDSRIYHIGDDIAQITEDQTFVGREIKLGRMTKEQAATDPRKNILLQCIGAVENLEPDYYKGEYGHNSIFFLCSDGCRHEVTSEEIYASAKPEKMVSEQDMEQAVKQLIEMNLSRGEKDNITAVMVKTV